MPKLMRPALTPVHQFGNWWAKRDDLAAATGPEFPSGSKVRQYKEMAEAYRGAPMLVGCSADSAMSIYVAAAAHQAGVPGIIYTAGRAKRTAAIEYAMRLGAQIVEVRPGYLSNVRAKARAKGKELTGTVRWNAQWAIEDAAEQTANLPQEVKRIVIPSGSGLTAVGVLLGLTRISRNTPVLAVAVSGMFNAIEITQRAVELARRTTPLLEYVRAEGDYGRWEAARLPDGTPLDPYYAAKAVPYLLAGDCLWLPGLRPLAAMPVECCRALGGKVTVRNRL